MSTNHQYSYSLALTWINNANNKKFVLFRNTLMDYIDLFEVDR